MKLYVGNMPFSANEDELRELFEQYGPVDSAAVVTDRETGRSRGFGFVEMSDEDGGTAAIEALNGHSMGGRSLVVDKARPRPDRGGGRGGRGGYGNRGNRW